MKNIVAWPFRLVILWRQDLITRNHVESNDIIKYLFFVKNPRGLERERYHLHRKYLKSAQYPRFDHSFACITVYQRLRYSSIPSTDVHDLKIARNDRLFGTSFSPRPLSLRRTRKEFEKNLWKKHVSFPIQTISLIFNFTGVSLEYVRIFINIRPPSLLDQMTMIAKLLHGSLTVHRARRVVFRKQE